LPEEIFPAVMVKVIAIEGSDTVEKSKGVDWFPVATIVNET